jgi:hypothetical protein
MGRTNPTFRDTLRHMEDQWQPYRRGLRRRDQPAFDDLWGMARGYADAGGYLNHANPTVVMLFSVCLAQQRRLNDLEDRLDEVVESDSEFGRVIQESEGGSCAHE